MATHQQHPSVFTFGSSAATGSCASSNIGASSSLFTFKPAANSFFKPPPVLTKLPLAVPSVDFNKASFSFASSPANPKPDVSKMKQELTIVQKYRLSTLRQPAVDHEANKENWDPMKRQYTNLPNAQPASGTFQAKRKFVQSIGGGPLADITNIMAQQNPAMQAAIQTVKAEFVGLGWGGEAFTDNSIEMEYQVSRKKRFQSRPDEQKDMTIKFMDRPREHEQIPWPKTKQQSEMKSSKPLIKPAVAQKSSLGTARSSKSTVAKPSFKSLAKFR